MAGIYLNENMRFSAIKHLEHSREVMCPKCSTQMEFSPENYGLWKCSEQRCNETKPYLYEDWLLFLGYYNPNKKGESKTFSNDFYTLKYNPGNTLLPPKFAKDLFDEINKRIGMDKIDFCVSIPNSIGQRNDVIGRVFKYFNHKKYFPDMLKSDPRKSQKKAGKLLARWANIKGAFTLQDPQSVRGSKILLLDDLVTTGASMHEGSITIARESGEYVWVGAMGKNWRY